EPSPSAGNELQSKPVLQPLTVSNVAANKPNVPGNSSADSDSVSHNQARNSVVKEPSPSVGNELQSKPVIQPLTVSNVAANKPNVPGNSSANTETASAKPRN